MAVLILAEREGDRLKASVYRAVTAAQSWQQPVHLLLLSDADNESSLVTEAQGIDGVARVYVAVAEHLAHPVAEDVAPIVTALSAQHSVILAASSAFSKNVLPRIAALLDVGMLSDVVQILSPNTVERPIYAGNLLVQIRNDEAIQVLTVRASRFAAAKTGGQAEVLAVTVPAADSRVRFVGLQQLVSDRPSLPTAKVVVSGGRSLGSADKFAEVLTPLADKLDAALGATRAAVDAGYAANELQVGQTGTQVAPELYFAIGISGAVQHTAGMKDSGVIVAINQDPEAPIFQVADYILVADLFEAVPALTAALD